MFNIKEIKEKVLLGYNITKSDAKELIDIDLDELTGAANNIRSHFCGEDFDICTIINAKSGKCSENCKYCAQSSHYNTSTQEYPLLDCETVVSAAKHNKEGGALRYSLVTSGRNITNKELDLICENVKEIIKNCDIKVCVSLGLLNYEQYLRLKQCGVTRIHNNLETAAEYFDNICSTHSYYDKITSIKAAKKAELDVCSGGIMGLGESMNNRIDMAFALRDLKVVSVPINILNAISNTPFENTPPLTYSEILRIIAIYRFILPKTSIRLAGGRNTLADKGERCFTSGANAVISGDMLTTWGTTLENDSIMIKKLGYIIK